MGPAAGPVYGPGSHWYNRAFPQNLLRWWCELSTCKDATYCWLPLSLKADICNVSAMWECVSYADRKKLRASMWLRPSYLWISKIIFILTCIQILFDLYLLLFFVFWGGSPCSSQCAFPSLMRLVCSEILLRSIVTSSVGMNDVPDEVE